MKVVILAGGFGTRISEESAIKPKPMVEIGNKPILWHIMKIFTAHGLTDFVICCGYRGEMIKEYFANYFLHRSDVTFDLRANQMHVHQNYAEPWRVTVVDTGSSSMTGGRLKRVRPYLGDETFCHDLRRRRVRRQHPRADRSSTARTEDQGDADRRAAAGTLRRLHAARAIRRTIETFHEKPTRRRRLDQRRLLRPRAGGDRLHRRRPHRVGTRAARAAGAAKDSCPPIATAGSGRRWTRCATRWCSRILWARQQAPWKIW